MSNPADARRRWFGLFFLFTAIGMIVWGFTILKPHLDGLLFLGYWLACFGFTFLAMLTALLDMWIVRHRTKEEHRQPRRNRMGPTSPAAADPRMDKPSAARPGYSSAHSLNQPRTSPKA